MSKYINVELQNVVCLNANSDNVDTFKTSTLQNIDNFREHMAQYKILYI
jgi:hypothetical protein